MIGDINTTADIGITEQTSTGLKNNILCLFPHKLHIRINCTFINSLMGHRLVGIKKIVLIRGLGLKPSVA